MDVTYVKTHIRWMVKRDMEEVMEIERLNFEYPWTEEELVWHLRQKYIIGMVAEQPLDGRVLGFMVYELHRLSIGILNLAVLPAVHGKGVGHSLIEKLKSKLSLQRRRALRMIVRETNLDALLFLQSQRFVATNVLRDYWETGEDAILMEYQL